MARKKFKYQKKSFESTGESSDTSANIYVSMLKSRAWKSLSKNAQTLYVYCKAQYYAEHKKPVDINNVSDSTYFTFSQHLWKDEYELYTNLRQFYKDMNLLIEYGFIDIVESGKFSKTKNIYKFSNRWQNI